MEYKPRAVNTVTIALSHCDKLEERALIALSAQCFDFIMQLR